MGALDRMSAIQTPEVLRRQLRFLLFLLPMLFGALIGVFVLHPVNEFVFYIEHRPEGASSARSFVLSQLWASLRGQTLLETAFYAGAGAALGLLSAFIFNALYKRARQIQQLSSELQKDVLAFIGEGESGSLEFKASFRWDMKQEKVNKALEAVVVKTLAGFMNADGGTLLIGVTDDGEVLGLDKDYGTLKKKNRDGFEQAIMSAVAANIGTDACRQVHVVFHDMQGKDVCRVIAKSSPRPVYMKQDNTTLFYLRAGGGTRKLNVEEAVDYIADHWSK